VIPAVGLSQRRPLAPAHLQDPHDVVLSPCIARPSHGVPPGQLPPAPAVPRSPRVYRALIGSRGGAPFHSRRGCRRHGEPIQINPTHRSWEDQLATASHPPGRVGPTLNLYLTA
jgi:hypothetical protein